MSMLKMRFVVALSVTLGSPLGFAPRAGAQSDFPDSIVLQVHTCPPGMTAETLVGDDCTPTTAGFDVRIISLEGIAEPLTLADATLDRDYFVFGDELVNQRGLTGSLRIEETALPAGYTSYVVLGASPAPDGSGYDFENPADADAPDPLLTIFNFAPADGGSDEGTTDDTDDEAAPTLPNTDTETAEAETRGPIVEVDIDEDGEGTIAFDLDGDGTIEFTIGIGIKPAFDR